MKTKKDILFLSAIEPPSSKWWHYMAYAALLFILVYISNVDVALADNNVPGPASWVATSVENAQTESGVSVWNDQSEAEPVEAPVQEPDYDLVTFTISAYYSPLQGQNKYVTGSYAGDIRLNGGGVRGADGTPVYPGMIAAPPSYAFGTKMHIPGIGTVAVHDRGGAIKGNRLDVWMGYGDIGLQRALKWGKRTLEVKVYGINDAVVEEIELEGYSESERHIVADQNVSDQGAVTVSAAPAPVSRLFSGQLQPGSSGHDVAKLQEILKKLGFYEGEISSVFDEATKDAVARFQVSKNIVSSSNSYGAGYVGPVTSSVLASVHGGMATAHAKSEEISTDGIFSVDFKPGDSGPGVLRLQEELRRVNLFGIEPTGYYGELTEHAILKFQQIHRLAADGNSAGAGIFGPITRSKMNEIVAARLKVEDLASENS